MMVSSPDTAVLHPEPDVPDISGIDVNKRALQRLRWYFERRRGYKVSAQFDAIDLDLLRVGAINYLMGDNNLRSDYAVITRVGIQLLACERERNRRNRQPHNVLAHKLGGYLRGRDRLVWENVEFKIASGLYARPDVFSVVATHTEKRLAPMVHEVKISRADFLADVANKAKREAYSKIATCVYYAMPEGIAEPGEIPDGCGMLVQRDDETWVVRKRARRNDVKLSAWHYMNLVLKSSPEVGSDV